MGKKKQGFTVAELIAALESLKKPDAVVRMSSDPEGNDIRFFDAISPDSKTLITLWPGAHAE